MGRRRGAGRRRVVGPVACGGPGVPRRGDPGVLRRGDPGVLRRGGPGGVAALSLTLALAAGGARPLRAHPGDLGAGPLSGDLLWERLAATEPGLRAEAGPRPRMAALFGVAGLRGRVATLRGFMLPIDFDETGAREFLLLRRPTGSCDDPQVEPGDWVRVRVAPEGPPAPVVDGATVTVRGTLRVAGLGSTAPGRSPFLLDAAAPVAAPPDDPTQDPSQDPTQDPTQE